MKKKLVLFDFDGTITTRDTLLEFIRFYHGNTRFVAGFAMTSPWLALMVARVVPNWKAKERVLSWFFAGEELAEFDRKSEVFCRDVLPGLIRSSALQQIEQHKKENATIVVVSASAENWVRPWCRRHDLSCLATQLEITNGRLTGRINGFNCYGQEKERRLRACYHLEDYDEIVAYGDSRGDLEMLSLAQQQFYKPFRT